MDPKIRNNLLILSLLPLIYFQFFYRLGGIGLVGPDEPRYAQVAKEMLTSGDYVTPRLNGKPWFEKPVLYYWLTACFYKVLGVSESSARLTSALAASLGILVTFWLGIHWMGQRGGILASAILATSVIWFALARAASMDMLLSAALACAWTSLYSMLFPPDTAVPQKSSHQYPLHLSAYVLVVSLAASVLAKGPVGIILVGGSLALFLLFTAQFRKIKQLTVITAGLLFLLICFPWYWLCYQANGSTFIREFIVQHNVERFTTDRYQHGQPLWFYFGVLFVGFFPWVFQLLPPIIRLSGRMLRVRTQDESKELFFALWILVPLVFFSISRAKLPGYLLPVAPAVAVLVAREYDRYLVAKTTERVDTLFVVVLWLQTISVGLLGLGVILFSGMLKISIGPVAPQLAGLLILLGVLGGLLVARRKILAFVATNVAGVVLGVALITTQLLPKIDHLESSRQLASWLKDAGYVQNAIFLFRLSRYEEYGLNFYLDNTTRVVYSAEPLQAYIPGRSILILPDSCNPAELLAQSEIVRESLFDGRRIIEFRPRRRM